MAYPYNYFASNLTSDIPSNGGTDFHANLHNAEAQALNDLKAEIGNDLDSTINAYVSNFRVYNAGAAVTGLVANTLILRRP